MWQGGRWEKISHFNQVGSNSMGREGKMRKRKRKERKERKGKKGQKGKSFSWFFSGLREGMRRKKVE